MDIANSNEKNSEEVIGKMAAAASALDCDFVERAGA
jgi:hypothetical protein